MLVRVSSRQGITRIQLQHNSTVGQLKRKILAELDISPNDQQLSVRTGAGPTIQLDDNEATMASLNIKHGDIVYLVSPETTQHEEPAPPLVTPSLPTSNDLGSKSKPSTPLNVNVVEDEIDQYLRKQDGWVKRERSRYCNHPPKGSCGHCMPISPWNIQNHEEFEDLKLKHIPFHAWLREKEYRNPNNPVLLEDPTYKIENVRSLTSKENISVTLERQPFRHVDHLEFDTPAIVERFIAGWRESGKQRCGLLFGRYIADPSIPLGIRASISCIYEPPQQSTTDNVILLKDPNESMVEELAEKLGLKKIGFIWTSLLINEKKQIIPDRDSTTYHLKSQECIRMGLLQNKYPSPSKESPTGTFGSKFVSVLVYGNKDGNIEVAAYQISNQVARLIRDGAVRASKQPQFLRVRSSTKEVLYPDVFYRAKNEYGYMVNMKAEPTFPNEYCIVSVRHSFPKDPTPLFKSFDFPIENRTSLASYGVQTPSPVALKTLLSNKHGQSFFNALTDFHLILYLAQTVDKALFGTIMSGIVSPGSVIETQVRPALEKLWKEEPSQPAAPGLSPEKLELTQQLLLMGYSEEQATEALWATNYVSIEAAIDFLLSRM